MRLLLFIRLLPLLCILSAHGAQQVINLGDPAVEGSGDKARVGGQKINENFAELYARPALPLTGTGLVKMSIGTVSLAVAGTDYLKPDGSGAALTGITAAQVGAAETGHTHTFASLTSKPTTLLGYGITDAASLTHTHAFSGLTGLPTTIAGYGITDAAALSHTHTFSSLTGTPTTLSGYGITDAASNTHTHAFSTITSLPTTVSGYGITDAVTPSATQALTNKRITRRVVSVAYAATVTPSADNADVLLIGALTGGLTLANPSGTPTEGQALQIELRQDATGGRTLTLGTKYRIPTSSSLSSPIAETHFTTANKKTKVALQYDATDDKWDVVSFVPGY